MKLRVVLILLLVSSSVARAGTNAVERGLQWLATQQQVTGAWSDNVALNALPVLAFLSAGRVPGPGRQGDVVENGLRRMLMHSTFTDGGGGMYGHGIATLALAEVSGMTYRQTRVQIALRDAVGVILRAQAVPKGEFHVGGWRYQPDSTDSDLSVTVWQMAALRAASAAGVHVPQQAMDRAAAYIKRCEHPRGGFGYQPGGLPNQSRTAAGIFGLRLAGQGDDPAVARARRWLVTNPLRADSEFFYYAAYYCAQVGAGFDEQLLLTRQEADGGWPANPERDDERRGGRLYTTSMAVLALTAKEHYLPSTVE
jgi:hypothetical protein